MKTEDMINLATVAAVGLGLYLAYQGIQAAAKATKEAAGDAWDVVEGVSKTAGDVTSWGVGKIGQSMGLPQPSETLSNPYQVRWIMDHVGEWPASQWGTAMAYIKAVTLPAGSGDNNPPPAYVLERLGIPTNNQYPTAQALAVDLITGGVQFGNDSMITGPDTFGGWASGANTTNPFMLSL